MIIAIPIAEGRLAQHFGHCAQFALLETDPTTHAVLKREDVDAPPHQPGLLPPWLARKGARVVLAGGMGMRAKALFEEQGIRVIVGVPSEAPEKLVADYLAGTLQTGDNACDH